MGGWDGRFGFVWGNVISSQMLARDMRTERAACKGRYEDKIRVPCSALHRKAFEASGNFNKKRIESSVVSSGSV